VEAERKKNQREGERKGERNQSILGGGWGGGAGMKRREKITQEKNKKIQGNRGQRVGPESPEIDNGSGRIPGTGKIR